jgi:asparagine synthase (glutamine-hydrolysing)
MSGIAGIFYRKGKHVMFDQIEYMNNSLSHRGPDGSNFYCEEQVALGHQMLYSTPESIHEVLPLEEDGLVITADSRIDNREELSKILCLEDKEEISDSYFILKSYQKWGEKCPEKLLGDFAFTIYDKNNMKLFCARDHMGVKPFYYYLSDDLFIFASEIKALLNIEDIPTRLNKKTLASYLMVLSNDESTFYEYILKLKPAHSLSVTIDKKLIRKYWQLNSEYELILDSDKDYIEKFRELFTESVNCRLRSAFPIGSELSGGLDSSSIVCMINNILKKQKLINKKRISTFSFIFNKFPQIDEREYIKTVTDSCSFASYYILGDDISPLENIDTILWCQEQPFFSPNMAIIWNLYHEMQMKNMRIIFSGEGGDQVISNGTNYFHDLILDFNWIKLVHEFSNYCKIKNRSFFNTFLGKVFFPLIPEFFKSRIRPFYDRTISILNKDFSNEINAKEYLRDEWKSMAMNNTAKKYHYNLITERNVYALELRDKTCAFHSIEPRYPFLDKRLVEFCYSIPTEIKFKYGWDRYIQRIGLDDILPKENQWRRDKAILDLYYEKNLLSFEKDLLDEIIIRKKNIIKDYINLDLLKKTYNDYCKDNADSDSIYWIYLISILSLWLQKNLSIKYE